MTKERVHPTWTKEEDNIVKEAVRKTKKDGDTLKSAFALAAKTINRTVGSISFRWNNKLKHEPIEVKETTDLNSIQHLDVIKYIQNLKEQNEQYSKLKYEYDTLLNDYNSMSDKFSNISKIIS